MNSCACPYQVFPHSHKYEFLTITLKHGSLYEFEFRRSENIQMYCSKSSLCLYNARINYFHLNRTNFPKELMAYPDFEFTEPKHSYIWSNEMLLYIQSYATKFNVEPCIKFRHEVIRIRPLGTGRFTKWEVMHIIFCNNSINYF